MDCYICFEDKILHDDMVFFKCSHSICKMCLCGLKKRLCPFCRRKIKILSLKQVEHVSTCVEDSIAIDIDEPQEDVYYQNDFCIPIIRKNRQEFKRKNKEKRKNKLESLIKDTFNNKFFKLIPTLRKRKQKKLLMFLQT